jgi:hypothetical protein
MQKIHPRVIREKNTIEKMIYLYCTGKHTSVPGSLCPSCTDLLHYTQQRLTRCPFQEKKSTCAKCTVHCYTPAMRVKIRQVMAFAGPQMLVRYPLLTLRHFLDGLKPAPSLHQRQENK